MRQPYPGYQSSHVEWLGDLPEHWEVRRLGAALAETVGGGTPDTGNESYWADDDEEGLRWVAIADMSAGGEVTTTAKRVTSLGRAAARLRPLPAGTIIYSMYASVGAVARLSMSAATNQAILGLVPGEMVESSFLYWWLTGVRKPVLSLTRDNTQSNLNAETVRKIPLALPPLDEQRSISAFLDHETAKIDTLVAKKRLLLDRLAEFRTALITRTVTKGLPPEAAKQAGLTPNPPLKPSGVEWLGDVPEHWEVAQVRRWFDIVNGGTPASGDESYWDGETVWLTPDDLGRNSAAWISESRRRITDDGVRNSSARVSPEGSIILSTRAPIGHLAITAVPAATNQGCRTMVPNPETDSRFAYYSIMASRPLLQALGKGTTFMELTPTELGGFRMARPPLNEQQAIVEFVDRQIERIDDLWSQVETAIERLQEYRTALITAAVTGKIDVRDDERVETRASRT